MEENIKQKIICNQCGKEIIEKDGRVQEDYLHIKKEWGYFSEKDGVAHEINLCEACYDHMTKQFAVPIKEAEVTEYFPC
jgi:ribosomal-protein-alanine N-acetyltransferase